MGKYLCFCFQLISALLPHQAMVTHVQWPLLGGVLFLNFLGQLMFYLCCHCLHEPNSLLLLLRRASFSGVVVEIAVF